MSRIRRVGGWQAEAAQDLGLVKIDRASAKQLVERGIPVLKGSSTWPRTC